MTSHDSLLPGNGWQRPVRILRRHELEARLGISCSTIYDKLDSTSPRYDATFPKQIRLGTGGGAVGWLESEVEAWVQRQVDLSRSEG